MAPNRELKLSKAVLEMKFMKRTKERVEKEAAAAAASEEATGEGGLYASEITDEMRKGSCCMVEPSLALCLDLLDGRRSYRGMNPEVERLMRLEEGPQDQQAAEVEVSDAQMADYYNPLVDTMQKKFKSKNQLINNNPKNGPPRNKPSFSGMRNTGKRKNSFNFSPRGKRQKR